MSELESGVGGGLSACECPVCFLFLSEERLPMSMPCGHTLCKSCTDQLIRRSPTFLTRSLSVDGVPHPLALVTFSCPICREEVNADAVSLNVTLRDLIVELNKMNFSQKPQAVGTALNVNYSEIEFRELLDRGAYGEVHKAQWRDNDVAVKVFSSGQLTPDGMTSFRREVFVMNCLRHPNVILLMGVCQTPPHLAILMEFMPGGSLHKVIYIDRVCIPTIQIQSLAMDVCRGLQYLHSINFLHRDLKSKNILLGGKLPCQAKLCDFGLTRMRQESVIMTGSVGTAHWTAPEVLNNLRYQFPADIYSFGMVLYEMVCGRVPFDDMIPMAVALAVAVRRERPKIPNSAHPILAKLIRSCTQWLPAERPFIPQILSILSDLAPSPQRNREREQVRHLDSLGVVFVTADSADLRHESSEVKPKPASLLRQPIVYEDEPLKGDLNKDASESTSQQAEVKSPSPPLLSLGELVRLQLSPDSEKRKVTRVTSDQGPSCAVKVELTRTVSCECAQASTNSSHESSSSDRVTLLPLLSSGNTPDPSPTRTPIYLSEEEICSDDQEDEVSKTFGPRSMQKVFLDAVMRGKLKKVKECYQLGADPATVDKNGWTPLHHAARLGNKNIVQFLADHLLPEELNIVESEKLQTPLHKAAWFGHRSICKILVEKGASLTIADYQGNTPYHKSVQSEDDELQRYLKQKERSRRIEQKKRAVSYPN